MRSYEEWFSQNNRVELSILYILGLFDRPAPPDAIEALRKSGHFLQISEELDCVNNAQWQFAVETLRSLGLVNPQSATARSLDAHPLIREYFSSRLKLENPALYKTAHRALFVHYKDQAPELPNTPREMELLVHAIVHGCSAGCHEETFKDVYWPRVRRKDEHFNVHQLGLFGDDLYILSHYFDQPWDTPWAGLNRYDQSEVANWAGYCLQALGRLNESLPLMKMSLLGFAELKANREAAIVASIISGIQLFLGQIPPAIDAARTAVMLADASNDLRERIDDRTILAEVLFASGDAFESERWFSEACALGAGSVHGLPLTSAAGYRHWDFLISKGETQTVFQQATKALALSGHLKLSIVAKAMCHLAISRAIHIEQRLHNEVDSSANEHFEAACTTLLRVRRSGSDPTGIFGPRRMADRAQRFPSGHRRFTVLV